MKTKRRTWIEQEEELTRLTLEGMADVDAGRTIAHQAVVDWVASLGTDSPLPVPQPELESPNF
jgi:predicted transcriptional regulator